VLVEIACEVVTVQLPPNVQLCPFTVVVAFAKAVLGIALAATLSAGVVVAVATLGVSHDGQFAALA
jgi:hypothetical protein